jgi:hypothetical protein
MKKILIEKEEITLCVSQFIRSNFYFFESLSNQN